MNIVIATDSFKGCCTTLEAAAEFKRGILRVFPNACINIIPIADGGEGTVSAVLGALGGSLKSVRVKGPLGQETDAVYGIAPGGRAVLEMAAASGLTLVKGKKDPMRASTYGTGELIKAALDSGCTDIYIGIGGSATNDGGAGMAEALGVRFADQSGRPVPPGGGSLHLIDTIDISNTDKRLKNVSITVMSDVTNPLCGENGASAVYGPQKGATPEQVKLLDSGLEHLARKACKQLHTDFAKTPGAGAAGGLGFGLMAFTGARLRSGIEAILDLGGFDGVARDADLIITGEGNLDAQSAMGKVLSGIARRAKAYGKPVIAIAGGIGAGAERIYEYGIDAAISSTIRPMTVEEAMGAAGELLAAASERAMRLVKIGMLMKGKGE